MNHVFQLFFLQVNWVKRQFASNNDRDNELVVFGLYSIREPFMTGLLNLLDHLVYAADDALLGASGFQC